jgi:uncharacterized protein (TIRG00374 family)
VTIKQKKALYVILGLAISVILLWVLLRNIDFAKLVEILRAANYYWLIPNIVLVMFAMYQRAYRWRFMLVPIKQVAFSKLLAATCVGFMANNVLPLRLGEFVRAYSLSAQESEVTKSASLATIFVERMVFDLVALLSIFGLVLYLSDLAISEQIRTGIMMSIGIAFIGIVFVLVMALKPDKAGDMLTRYLFFVPATIKNKIKDIILKFSRGLEFIRKPGLVVSVALQTLAVWIFMGISNYFVFMMFDFNLPISASYVLLVIVSISILIPSSPGFIGVYHAGAVLTLNAYGIGNEGAVSFALVLHAAQYIPITLMGFNYLKKEHLSLKRLEEEAVEGPSAD